jgi:hypothetical protein
VEISSALLITRAMESRSVRWMLQTPADEKHNTFVGKPKAREYLEDVDVEGKIIIR